MGNSALHIRQLGIVAVLTAGLLAGASAGRAQSSQPVDVEQVWPGYVPDGRFFRNIEWGVSLWAPAPADMQLQNTSANVLVRYAMPATGERPGYVVSVIASRVREELPPQQMLDRSAEQLREALGPQARQVKVVLAEQGQAKLNVHYIGRLIVEVGAAGNVPGAAQPIHRVYAYLKLRDKQFLTLAGESSPAGAAAVDAVLDSLIGSVRVFDPQQAREAINAAAARGAKLLEGVTPAQWAELARQSPEQYVRAYQQLEVSQPAQPVGYGRFVTRVQPGGQFEYVNSSQIRRPEVHIDGYLSFYANLVTGDEVVRYWSRTTEPGRPGGAVESFMIARRKAPVGDGLGQFEVTLRTTGQPPRTYVAKVPSQPYLPAALQDLLPQRADQQAGEPIGLFSFSAAHGQVVFQTLEPAGPARLSVDGQSVAALRWISRPSVALPRMVRWTDPTGARTLRISPTPTAWVQSVADEAAPAEVKAALRQAPQWP